MGIKKQYFKNGVHFALLAALCLVVVPLFMGESYGAPGMPSSGEKQHMKLVGYNDLQARETLQVTAKGDWLFVGHHNGYNYNPLTDADEWNGTTILDISDPANPTITAHIPNPVSTNSRSAQVVYNYMERGEDYLIRNAESVLGDKFEIYNITDRYNPVFVGAITGTPVGSCVSYMGQPCGGILTSAHKGWWSPYTGVYYAAANEPGFRSQHMVAWDLSNFEEELPDLTSTFLGRAWLPGQKDDEPAKSLSWHHPIVDEFSDFGPRAYGDYLTGGDIVSVDISAPIGSNYQFPVKWTIDTQPPGRGAHTGAVIRYDDVPNFGEGALPRYYFLMADEAGGGDMYGLPNPVRCKVYMFDVTHAETTGLPFPVETWQVPNGDFGLKGGRFGPHQFAETRDGEYNLFEDRLAVFAYFNAGARVVDISDPYNLKEVGYYVPQENERMRPMAEGQPVAVQVNDVDIDYRDLIYASDRRGGGLWVLEYTGK